MKPRVDRRFFKGIAKAVSVILFEAPRMVKETWDLPITKTEVNDLEEDSWLR